jgi:hypothetical protein
MLCIIVRDFIFLPFLKSGAKSRTRNEVLTSKNTRRAYRFQMKSSILYVLKLEMMKRE